MSRRLDIGMACFGKITQLPKTIAALQQHSTTDWRLFLVVNPHPRNDMREIVCGLADRDSRIVPIWLDENRGYAGAVNVFLSSAITEYCAYVDDDATVGTPGWDELLCAKLDAFHEIGMIFPNGGAYMIDRGNYQEIMWGVGFCWVMNRMCATDLSEDLTMTLSGRMFGAPAGYVFDENLGHQEEACVCMRVRMAGWKCAAIPQVFVQHAATATNDPTSTERINRGVVRWVDKYNRYFNGKSFSYHSPNVTRFEDWPPQALYLEEWWKLQGQAHVIRPPMLDGDLCELDRINAAPEVIECAGREYDLIRVPRYRSFYVNRII